MRSIINNIFTLSLILCFLIPNCYTMAQGIPAIDQRMESLIAQGKIPGGVALVMHKGNIVHHQAYGKRSAVDSVPMRADDIFRIASMTKAIVSVALLQLIEKNDIPLDTPLHTYLPAFKNQPVAIRQLHGNFTTRPASRAVTLRDVLTHRSGISAASEHPAFLTLFKKHGLDDAMHLGFQNLQVLCDSLAAMPLVHDPGARFSYGASTDVVGRLIEVISGEQIDQYLLRHVFRPLRMKDTRFRLNHRQANRLVPITITGRDGKPGILNDSFPVVGFPTDHSSRFYSAAGGLVSTASDYARFLECLRLGGKWKGKRVLSTAWVDSLLTDQLAGESFIFGGMRGINGFGLGVGITSKAGSAVTHASPGSFFWGGALNSSYLVDRKKGIITVFLFQRTPFDMPSALSGLERLAMDALENKN